MKHPAHTVCSQGAFSELKESLFSGMMGVAEPLILRRSTMTFDSTQLVNELRAELGDLSATPTSPTRIDLAWTDTNHNESGFKIERSLDGMSDWTQIATVGANVINYADTHLASRTTYYYRVRTYNAGGDSEYSNIANETTEAYKVYLPLVAR
jgi:hypothetical protein